MKFKECPVCKIQITNQGFKNHIKSCNGKLSWYVRKKNNLPINSINNKKYDLKNYNWEKIQTYYNDNHTFMDVCREFKCNTTLLSTASKQGLFVTRSRSDTARLRSKYKNLEHSKENKEKISSGMRKAVLEGRQKTLKPYGKFCKIFHHISWLGNEEILHGGWELKVALFLDSKKIKWNKPRNSFTYVWLNKKHEYFPDFFLKDYQNYIEVKGQKTERDEAKWSQFSEKLLILDHKHINNLEDFFSFTNK
jgi:hypothetical protein